jgi:ergothioneine biosynthesis protein EgtB
VAEVWAYRQFVDGQIECLLTHPPRDGFDTLLKTVELGVHHEQQHQELILTDIKHVLSCNPLFPAYQSEEPISRVKNLSGPTDASWLSGHDGIAELGSASDAFTFDNERPRHQVLLHPHRVASRLVTCGEYRQFIQSGGYRDPQWWLSLGWQTVEREGWDSPLYWHWIDGDWQIFTLHGLRAMVDEEPVCHVSFFEADAYARWSGCRLPTEAEWESLAARLPINGNFAESRCLHPVAADEGAGPRQFFGDLWEWTSSPYAPYPGYRPVEGALGEYNGKFMCNQYVLRGGSCATPQSHFRVTYRNFFPPEARWQFTGIRLGSDTC